MKQEVPEFFAAGQKLTEYVLATYSPEDTVLARVRERTAALGVSSIHVRKMDGLHLEVLARAVCAKKAVEVGTLTGYSAICIARGLAPGGKLYTCELVPELAAVALEHVAEAGLSDRVEARVGPAKQTLAALSREGPFDLVFIDADKESYPGYLDWAAEHLRIGGLLIADNTFSFGQVARGEDQSGEARAVREFNERVCRGGRFRATVLPTGDGMTVAVKLR